MLSYVAESESISIRVDGRHEVEVHVVEESLNIVSNELIDEVSDRSGGDPFSGVNTCVQIRLLESLF